MSTPIIRHVHLHNITAFTRASQLQDALVRQLLNHKALLSSQSSLPNPPPRLPTPTLLSFSPTPVYTLGRRELGTLTPAQIILLQQPLIDLQNGLEQVAEIQETLRGGQITFHGPGQLVLYPVLDLSSIRSPAWPKGLSVRCYVSLLEETTIKTLKRYGIEGKRTENPGVWLNDDIKIAALGVHLRRRVSSYGVGLNIATDLRWFGRITACGLAGKGTGNMRSEWVDGYREGGKDIEVFGRAQRAPEVPEVAGTWAMELARGLFGSEGAVTDIPIEKLDVLQAKLFG